MCVFNTQKKYAYVHIFFIAYTCALVHARWFFHSFISLGITNCACAFLTCTRARARPIFTTYECQNIYNLHRHIENRQHLMCGHWHLLCNYLSLWYDSLRCAIVICVAWIRVWVLDTIHEYVKFKKKERKRKPWIQFIRYTTN